MPAGSLVLKPGVNTQKTLAANEAGVSVSQAIRYQDGMIQAQGGWTQYVPFSIGSTARALHAWQDAAAVKHLAVAGTANLAIITNGSNSDVTPQTSTTNFSPKFTIAAGSCQVSVTDAQ
jgi:hypothetical protein